MWERERVGSPLSQAKWSPSGSGRIGHDAPTLAVLLILSGSPSSHSSSVTWVRFSTGFVRVRRTWLSCETGKAPLRHVPLLPPVHFLGYYTKYFTKSSPTFPDYSWARTPTHTFPLLLSQSAHSFLVCYLYVRPYTLSSCSSTEETRHPTERASY